MFLCNLRVKFPKWVARYFLCRLKCRMVILFLFFKTEQSGKNMNFFWKMLIQNFHIILLMFMFIIQCCYASCVYPIKPKKYDHDIFFIYNRCLWCNMQSSFNCDLSSVATYFFHIHYSCRLPILFDTKLCECKQVLIFN